LRLVVSVDVEEEGLFTGCYPPGDAPVSNVRRLLDLDPMFRDLGIRPTLLVTYQVARHEEHREFLADLRERWGGEIGAHLHPWNTPPLDGSLQNDLVPSEGIPAGQLAAKLEGLLETLQAMGPRTSSFRMGRFDMGPRMFSVLEREDVAVDSSIAPLRRKRGGPDHLLAPSDPYHPSPADPCTPGASRILEVPITIVPLVPWIRSVLRRISVGRSAPPPWVVWSTMYLFSLPAQPVWTGLGRLKAAARLHRGRGGQVLTLFFHSSELLPGGSPAHPTQGHVDRFMGRLGRFLRWLRAEMGVESATLSEIRDPYPPTRALAVGDVR